MELDDGVRDRLYVAHAYAKVPVTGGADVSDVSLDGTVPLPYLSGRYEDGESMMVPVVPARRTVQMEANGARASLDIADVLGGTGLRIAILSRARYPSRNPARSSRRSRRRPARSPTWWPSRTAAPRRTCARRSRGRRR